MLSNSSFNALLKTVEEPPPNVVFVMATTELHKVPDTITSRSQEFIFRTIPQGQIFARLSLIADAEKIDIDDAALQMIARSGEGSMRDAQSNFDQVISFSDDMIRSEDVTKALGLASGEVIEKVISSIGTGESKAALDVIAELVDRGQDLRSFCRDVLGVIRDLLMYKVTEGETSLLETSVLSTEAIRGNSDKFSEADLIRFFHSLAETETQLKDAVQSRYVLEIGLVKLIEMRRLAGIEDILTRLGQLEEATLNTANTRDTKSAGAAAAPEKKTLESGHEKEVSGLVRRSDGQSTSEEYLADEIAEPDLGIGYRDLGEPPSVSADSPAEVSETPTTYDDLSFVTSLPVKLPPIDSADLEHFDDKRLDAQFERKLEVLDETGPIQNVSQLMKRAFGESRDSVKPIAVANGSAAAPARAPLNIQIPDFTTDESHEELPLPPESASEDELIAYAESQRSIRVLKRVFRARVTSVRKSEPSS